MVSQSAAYIMAHLDLAIIMAVDLVQFLPLSPFPTHASSSFLVINYIIIMVSQSAAISIDLATIMVVDLVQMHCSSLYLPSLLMALPLCSSSQNRPLIDPLRKQSSKDEVEGELEFEEPPREFKVG